MDIVRHAANRHQHLPFRCQFYFPRLAMFLWVSTVVVVTLCSPHHSPYSLETLGICRFLRCGRASCSGHMSFSTRRRSTYNNKMTQDESHTPVACFVGGGDIALRTFGSCAHLIDPLPEGALAQKCVHVFSVQPHRKVLRPSVLGRSAEGCHSRHIWALCGISTSKLLE